MRIDTHNGFTILADDADYELLVQHSWYGRLCGGTPYAYTRMKGRGRGTGAGKIISMHRLLMKPDPDMVVHHRNGNGLDNRRANLQVTTNRINIRHAHIVNKCPACADPIDDWWVHCAMCGVKLQEHPAMNASTPFKEQRGHLAKSISRQMAELTELAAKADRPQ